MPTTKDSSNTGPRSRERLFCLGLALLALTGWGASAQRPARERIRFEPGRTSAVLRGSVSGRTSREYLLYAREGQRMTVHLAGPRGPVFDIRNPDGSGLSMLQERDWEGELPLTGTYRIHVEGETEDLPRRSYTLEVGIR